MNAVYHICQQLECEEATAAGLYCAMERFGGSEKEAANADENLGRWYDLQYPGLRQLLRLYLEEFLSLFQEDSSYRIYASVPCPTVLPLAFNRTGKVRVYTAEFCSMLVLHGILGQNINRLNSGDGCAHCGLLESRFQYLEQDCVPRPDLLWSFGLLCDECPKTDERIQALMQLEMLSTFCGHMSDEQEFKRYEKSLRDDIETVMHRTGLHSLPSKQAWDDTRRIGLLIGEITCRNNEAEHPPLKAASLAMIHSACLMAFRNSDALILALTEIRRNIKADLSVRQRPIKKIYCYYIPPCVPEFGSIFERYNIRLLGDAAFLSLPVYSSFDQDLAGYAAASWQSAVLSRDTEQNITATVAAIEKYHCDGYLTGLFSFDRWLGAGHKLSAERIEQYSGKHVYQTDTDFWGLNFNPARIDTFAQTLLEMV